MVDIRVLDTDFQIVGVIDTYESFIWTDRFNSYGDFELYTAFDQNLLDLCQQDYYLEIDQSEHMMIIEGIEIEYDAESGNHIRITGRSLESILDRRIVWQQMTIAANTKFQAAMKRLIDDAILNPQPYSGNYSPTNPARTRKPAQLEIANQRIIHNFVFEETDDPYIDSITVEKTQYTGDVLYDIFQTMFEDVNNTIGYKITLDKRYIKTIDSEMNPFKTYYELINNQYIVTSDTSFQQGKTYYEYTYSFVFKLYSGTDYSYAQKEYRKTLDKTMQTGKTYYELVNDEYVVTSDISFQQGKTYYEHYNILPYVVFSPMFDNVINSNYLDNTSEMKNVTLVAGSGEGTARKTIIVGSGTDLVRRELFTDARDLNSSDYGATYTDKLKNRGYNKLVEYSRTTSYEGQVEATRQFVYGQDKDFYMGDIIQMANEYGIEGNARVIEWVLSDSSDGIETYPTFDAVQLIDDSVIEEDNDV